MKRQTFIFFLAAFSLVIISSYILISSVEKKEGAYGAEVENNIEEIIEVPKPSAVSDCEKYSVRVGLRYDNQGELMRFDSAYSAYFASLKINRHEIDSLIAKFHSYYLKNSVPLINGRFESLFFGDSLLYVDFFHRDYFNHRFKLNNILLDEMMSQLDSLKNDFFLKKRGPVMDY